MKRGFTYLLILLLLGIGSFFIYADTPVYRGWGTPLLKTGQTTSYVDYDDGYYEKGIAKSYTVLTAGQFAGTTNITINSKTDVHSNNCVLDNNTGLMWSRYVSASVGPASDGKIPWTTTGAGATAEGIYPYCAAANVALLGGYGDWRIPYDMELISLRDMEQPNAAPDAVAFPGWPTDDYFWSSTTLPPDVSRAMVVHFNSGGVANDAKTKYYLVALVRGG
jgi:hypothetical protein